MAFTEQDLMNVEKALASGELRVKLGDKEVEYRRMTELIQLWKLIQRELKPTSPTGGRIVVDVAKGY